MTMRKLLLTAVLACLSGNAFAGVFIGMASAAKDQVEQLDNKVREHQAANPSPSPTPTPTPTPPTSHGILFRNYCSETIWVGSLRSSGPTASFPNGWVMPQNSTYTVSVPDRWSGRFWPRTGCDFSANCTGAFCCKTGDCGKASPPLCDAGKGDEAPATLMEITFNGDGDNDYYDISFVDGFNRSMSVEPWGSYDAGTMTRWCGNGGCNFSDATSPNAPVCPDVLKYAPDGNKSCLSPCKYVTRAGSTEPDEVRARHCCSCSEQNLSPGAVCINNCNSFALGYGYNCSPYNNNDLTQRPACLCDPLLKFLSAHGNVNKAWDTQYQAYINNVESKCPTVYGWQYHDDHGLYQCRKSTGCSGSVGCMSYIVTFCPR